VQRYLVLAVSALLIGAAFAIRLAFDNPNDSALALFVLPIALMALVWGGGAGLLTALVCYGLFVTWAVVEDVHVGAFGYVARACVYFPIALIVGVGAERLRESRRSEATVLDRQREILDTSNEAFIAVDREGVISSWNPAAENTFGWPAEEAIGRPLAETVVPERMRAGFSEGLRNFLETGAGPLLGERVEIVALRRDGGEIPIELSLSAAQEGDDWVFHGFMHDISERKESERRLREAARYFELSHDLIGTATTDGYFDRLNDRWQTTLGWTPDELRGRPFVEFVHEDDREATIAETAKLAAGDVTVDFRNRYRAKDGSWHWLDWSAAMVPDEERIYAAARDVTERVAVELANARLGAIVEFSDDAIYGYTLDGEITSWNPAAERLYGYTHEEAIGMSLRDLVPPDRPDDTPALIASIARGAPVKDAESLRIAKDGSRVEVSLTLSPVRDAAGTIVGAATIARDISDRKRTWRYTRAQHQTTGVLAEAPAVPALGGRILPILAQCAEWTWALHWVSDEDDPGRMSCDATWTAPRLRGPVLPVRVGTIWQSPPGAERPVEPVWESTLTEASPVPIAELAASGGVRTAVWVPISIDGRLAAGFEFFAHRPREPDDQLLDVLTAVVAQMGHYIERRRAEQETERTKDEFFSLISHELRTPLTSIIGYTEALAETEGDSLSDRGRGFLDVVDRNARRELRLVGDLLALVRIEAGTFSIEPGSADLAQIVAEAVEAARPNAERHGVDLAVDADDLPEFEGDSYRLGQVVDNLLTNAIKFSPDGGHVDVRVGRRDGRATIEVSDSGMGISPEDRERLFERLFRAKGAAALQIPGTGLGLTIVKAIVDAHGGEIEVESEEGVGTTFRISLPMRPPDRQEREAIKEGLV